LRKPVLGWGRWGRSRVYDETGRDISVTDGLWVITLGESGLLGLAGLMLMFTLPVWVLGWRARGLAREPRLLLAGGCVIVSLNLFNTIPNAPVLPPVNLLAGGLGTMAVAAARGARPASRRGRGGRGPDAEAEAPPWPRSIPMQTRSLP